MDSIKKRKEIKKLWREKQFEKAESLARKLVEDDPEDIKNKNILIRALILTRKLAEAEKIALEILNSGEQDASTRSQLCTIYSYQGKLDEAEEVAKLVLENDEHDVVMLTQLIMICMQRGDLKSAEEYISKILAIAKPDTRLKRLLRRIDILKMNLAIKGIDLNKISYESLTDEQRKTVYVQTKRAIVDIYANGKKLFDLAKRILIEMCEEGFESPEIRSDLARIEKCREVYLESEMRGKKKDEKELTSKQIRDEFRQRVRNGEISLANFDEEFSKLSGLNEGELVIVKAEAYIAYGQKDLALMSIKGALKRDDISDNLKMMLKRIAEIAKQRRSEPLEVTKGKVGTMIKEYDDSMKNELR